MVWNCNRDQVETKFIEGKGIVFNATRVMQLLTGKIEKRARDDITKISTNFHSKDVIAPHMGLKVRFDGCTQDEHAMDIDGVMAVAMFVPGDNRAKAVKFVQELTKRFLAKDQTLINDMERIDENSTLHLAARSALEAGQGTALGKRPRTEEETIAFERSKVELERYRVDTALLFKTAYDAMIDKDDRMNMMFQDKARNLLFGQQLAITNGEDESSVNYADQYYVTEAIVDAGFSATPGNLSKAGKWVKAAYVAKYNENPMQSKRFVDGATRFVNYYHPKDKELVLNAIKEGFEAEAACPAPRATKRRKFGAVSAPPAPSTVNLNVTVNTPSQKEE